MDLLATVRKEGSRGGRGEFKWSDVQSSSHRENYLGHSVMAPVGRWQKGRDLNWYSKTGVDQDAVDREERERKEEIRRVKDAEQDAMARALGLPVPDRSNANMEELGRKRDVGHISRDTANNDATEGGKGLGYESGAPRGDRRSQVRGERIQSNAENQDRELQYALREYRRRHGDSKAHGRSRSRSRSADRDGKYPRQTSSKDHEHRRRRRRHRHSSRSRERPRKQRSKSRSRSRSRGSELRDANRGRERSRSPYRRDDSSLPRRRGRRDG